MTPPSAPPAPLSPAQAEARRNMDRTLAAGRADTLAAKPPVCGQRALARPPAPDGYANAVSAGRPDFTAIAQWIKPGAKVLDLGCGDGSLLCYLRDTRSAWGYGVEIRDENVLACVGNGVAVIQSDLESGLSGFETGSFDYVILSQTLQAMKHTEGIVKEMLRVGREGIVSFPNFGFWRHRIQIMRGHMPVSKNLPYQWFDTPNVHLCTINDFEAFCAQHRVRILQRMVMSNGETVSVLPNLLGTLAVYRIESRK